VVRLPRQMQRQVIELDTGARFAVHVCRPLPSVCGQARWFLTAQPLELGLAALICVVSPGLSSITKFYVVPSLDGIKKSVNLREDHPIISAGVELESLSQFYEAAVGCASQNIAGADNGFSKVVVSLWPVNSKHNWHAIP
jgi:hypothetical protein